MVKSDWLAGLQRINVIGTAGSGKSTFSRALSAKLDLPHIEMDKLYWLPHWREPKFEDFASKILEVANEEYWILDGNYSRTTTIKWTRANAVFWLDFPFTTTLFRVLKRSLSRAVTQEEIWPATENRESFKRTFFSRRSIILWAASTHRRNRRKYTRLLQDPTYKKVQFFRLRNSNDIRAIGLEIGDAKGKHRTR